MKQLAFILCIVATYLSIMFLIFLLSEGMAEINPILNFLIWLFSVMLSKLIVEEQK